MTETETHENDKMYKFFLCSSSYSHMRGHLTQAQEAAPHPKNAGGIFLI